MNTTNKTLQYGTFLFTLFTLVVLHVCTVYGASNITRVSDLISTSAPSVNANHTIRFTLTQAIPADGAIEVYFNEGGVTIPPTMNFSDIDLSFAASAGGPYTDRPLSSVQTPGTDDVTVTTGPSGSIRFDLNTSIGIPAGNVVVIEIGTQATYGSIGDVQLQNDNATSSYPVEIYTYDTSDVELDYGETRFVIIDQVTIGPVDTTDQTPPVITYAEPTGILQVGTRAVEIHLITNEFSSCRYATSSMLYDVMPYYFYGTSSGLVLNHFTQVTGLEDDSTYTYFIRCVDFRLNEIDPDYELTFDVGVAPGSATTTSTSTGGTGTGNASTTATSGPGTGDDTGTGDGPTGTGDGDGPDGGDGSGSGSGGSGSSASGTKLPQADVKIDGWAYPGATVSYLRDGKLIDSDSIGSDGVFSNLTTGLDRGSYTFSIYAVDSNGVRSSTFNTTLWLRAETVNAISNVMLPPTVQVPNNSVNPGEALSVTGYSAPGSTVTVWLRPKLAEVSTADIIETAIAASNGTWSLSVPTTGLAVGTYELLGQSKMENGEVESDKSARKTIGIGVEVSGADGDCISIGDLNCDGSVNLVDFSILLFNWNTPSEVADINADGLVSLPDFSIMLFNWTG